MFRMVYVLGAFANYNSEYAEIYAQGLDLLHMVQLWSEVHLWVPQQPPPSFRAI